MSRPTESLTWVSVSRVKSIVKYLGGFAKLVRNYVDVALKRLPMYTFSKKLSRIAFAQIFLFL